MTNYMFRLLGDTSWGIVINIEADVISINNENSFLEENIKSRNRIWLELPKLEFFNDSRRKLLLSKGLSWVGDEIENRLKENERILIKVRNINIIPTDYQDEGLFFAIAGWASKHFNFVRPEFRYDFHKEKNRYFFPLLENIISIN